MFAPGNIAFKPLTLSNWDDFEKLFGPRGAYAGCWCMWWRLSRKDFEQGQGENNRLAMKSLVAAGQVPGILAYDGTEPFGWCSVAPRHHFSSLERSNVLKRIDDKDVWSITCFFIDRKYRGRNLQLKLIFWAIGYVRSLGGEIIEAYPVILRSETKAPPVSSFMGIAKTFENAGFKEVHRPSNSRVIMRCYL